jgi:hypothetical protein
VRSSEGDGKRLRAGKRAALHSLCWVASAMTLTDPPSEPSARYFSVGLKASAVTGRRWSRSVCVGTEREGNEARKGVRGSRDKKRLKVRYLSLRFGGPVRALGTPRAR